MWYSVKSFLEVHIINYICIISIIESQGPYKTISFLAKQTILLHIFSNMVSDDPFHAFTSRTLVKLIGRYLLANALFPFFLNK